MVKINVKMSQKIRTRKPAQCRSHNQKMLIKYGSIENIINGITLELKKDQMKSEFDRVDYIKANEV
jgi:hypothetical protein